MKNWRKFRLSYVLIFTFMTLFLFTQSALATESNDTSLLWDTSYDITAYHVDVDVSKDNILDVSETITTDFHQQKHGIYRDIPIINNITRTIDNEVVSKKYRVEIDNISITDSDGNKIKYSKSRENDNLRLTIGDSNKTIEGSHTYVIKYSYNIGDDGIKQFDQLSYNLIGYDWNTTISDITFAVHMPKSFDSSNVKVTSGFLNSNENIREIPYSVEGNTITGEIKDGFLSPNRGVTIRGNLPQGYFGDFKQSDNKSLAILFSIFIVLSLSLFFIYGRNKRIDIDEETSHFQGTDSLEDLDPAEAGYIMDGYVKSRHITALIIHLANKGYISIKNDEHDNFILIKKKDDDDSMKYYERFLFNKLFDNRETVTALELKNKFHSTVAAVKSYIFKSFKEPSRRLYTRSSSIAQYCSYVMAALSMGILIGKVVGQYNFSIGAGIVTGVVTFCVTLVFALIIGYCAQISVTKSKSPLLWSLIVYISIIIISVILVIKNDGNYYEAFAGAIVGVVCVVAGTYSAKRTEQYDSWLRTVLTIKHLIVKIEAREIEMLLNENPELVYNILPYAYVFGIQTKWMRKFSSIEVLPPHWYNNEQNFGFNMMYFADTMNHNFLVYENDMNSSQSNHSNTGGDFSSSDFGGGDFGGGGDCGGGGGGSW